MPYSQPPGVLVTVFTVVCSFVVPRSQLYYLAFDLACLVVLNSNVIATLYSKARATTVVGYKFTATFSEKKVHCSQVSNGNKNRLDQESFYQSNIERLLHLNPDDCKNELLRLNITRNKNTDRKIVFFQVFADSVHQAELERYQGHIKLDENTHTTAHTED